MTDQSSSREKCACGSFLERLTQDVFPPIFNVSCPRCEWRVRGRDAAEVDAAVEAAINMVRQKALGEGVAS